MFGALSVQFARVALPPNPSDQSTIKRHRARRTSRLTPFYES